MTTSHNVQYVSPREVIPGPPTPRPPFRPQTDVRRSQQGGSRYGRDSTSSTTQLKSRSELRLENDYRDLQESYSDLRRQFHDRQHEYETQASRTEMYIQDMEDRETKLKDKLCKLEDDHERYVQQTQLKSFRNMKQGRWLPLEDSSVQRNLELLQSNIKQWAKSSAIKDMKETDSILKQPAKNAALLESLGRVVRMEDGFLPPQLSNGRKAPVLCLNALLANEIHMHILADPFFFLEDDISPFIDRLPADPSILKQIPSPNLLYREMYETLKRVKPREAHLWRSQMLRILNPPIQDDVHPSEKRVKSLTEAKRQKVCSRHATAFLEGPARHLLHTAQENATSDRVQRLENIFQAAGNLSCQLWTQRTYFECQGLQDLKVELFSIDSEILEMHPLVHLDEVPARFNERTITMVVNPLVKAWGTDEAEDYDRSRVWAKAVVWLPLES